MNNSQLRIPDVSFETLNPLNLAITILAPLIVVAITSFNGFIICLLLIPGKFPKAFRVLLINMLAAIIFQAILFLVIVAVFMSQDGCLKGTHSNNTDELYCIDHNIPRRKAYSSLFLFGLTASVTVRMFFMGFYAILIYINIKYLFYKIRIWVVVIGCVGIWVVAGILNLGSLFIFLYTPYPTESQFHYTACIYGLVIPTVIFIPMLALSITLPILALRHIKMNAQTTAGNANGCEMSIAYKKAMAKLAIFLLISNSLALIGHLLPFMTIVVLAVSSASVSVGQWTVFITGFILSTASLLSTPILYLIFLKDIRQNAKKVLCRLCEQYSYSMELRYSESPASPNLYSTTITTDHESGMTKI